MLDLERTLPPVPDVVNLSPFALLVFSALDTDDEFSDIVVAKGAYRLRPNLGSDAPMSLALEPAPEASVIAVVDEYFGAVNKSSIRIESDLAPFKPKCDVVVIGSAHSPTGRPVHSVTVGIDIDGDGGERKLRHRLVASGPRYLLKRRGFERSVTSLARVLGADAPEWFVGEPGEFLDMPLRYEMAFGGELKVASDDEGAGRLEAADCLSDDAQRRHPDGAATPVAHTVCRLNPVGCGFLETWHARATRATRWPAPRIEAVGAPLTAELVQALMEGRSACGSDPALEPQGVGVVTKAWQPRLGLAGTFDDGWRRERAPFLPKDFDMAYWNGAHQAMQCAHLGGGEIVTLTNLMAAGAPGTRRDRRGAAVATFEVPAVELALRTKFDDGRVINALRPIDTLVVDLEAGLVQVVWRFRFPSGVPFVEVSLVSLAELRREVASRTVAA